MDIKIPKRAEDLRIRHFKAFQEWNEDGMQVMDKARFVAAFTGNHINSILSIDNDDFEKVYSHVIKVLSKLKISKKPPETIILGGMEYNLVDPHKTSTGWHMDWSELVKNDGYNSDPVRVACLFYHPKGYGYGEIDKNNNLLHPIKDKYEIFESELQLSTFIECSSFFLLKSARSISISMEKKIWEKRTEKLLKAIPFLRGKKQSIQ